MLAEYKVVALFSSERMQSAEVQSWRLLQLGPEHCFRLHSAALADRAVDLTQDVVVALPRMLRCIFGLTRDAATSSSQTCASLAGITQLLAASLAEQRQSNELLTQLLARPPCVCNAAATDTPAVSLNSHAAPISFSETLLVVPVSACAIEAFEQEP